MATDMTDPATIRKLLEAQNALANYNSAPTQQPSAATPAYGTPGTPAPTSFGTTAPQKDMSGFKSTLPSVPALAPSSASPAPTKTATGGFSGTLTPEQQKTYAQLPDIAKAGYLMSLGGSPGAPSSTVASGNSVSHPSAVGAAVSTNNTAQNYIEQMNQAKTQAQLAALAKSRDAALSNLGQERAGIQPKYQDARNQVASGGQQAARNFAEFMAQRGGASSGANAQASLMQGMATQGEIGSLGRQEAQAYSDIGRRTSDVGNAFESDAASAIAGGEADKMSALLQDFYNNQKLELQLDQLNYGRQRDSKLDAINADNTAYNRDQDKITNDRNAANDKMIIRDKHIAEANALSEKYGIPIEPKDDYQLMLDQVAGLPTLAQQTSAQKAQTEMKNEAWKRVEEFGVVMSRADSELLGVPVGTSTQKAKEAAMDNAYKNRTAGIAETQNNIDQQNANTAKTKAEAEANKPKETPAPKSTDYKLNPEFGEDIQFFKDNPNQISLLDSKAQAFIDAYGYDGYAALRKSAGLYY